MVIVFVAAVVFAALLIAARSGGPDLPSRVVASVAKWLPAGQLGWGQALVAELAVVQGRSRRWRFAAGVLRVALFPPAARPGLVGATASVCALLAATATVTADVVLPTMSVFVAVLGVLITGCAAAFASRWQGFPVAPSAVAAGAVAIVGILAVVGALLSVAAAHPAATRDPTHAYAIVLAVVLTGYLIGGIAATTRPAPGAALIGAVASVVVSAIVLPFGAVSGLVPPILAAATLVTAAVVAGRTRSRVEGARAGLLVAILGAPIQFAVSVIAQERAPQVLTNAYDLAQYPRSGFPDVASYLLSDALGGNIVLLTVTPLFMYAIAALGAAVAARFRPALSAA